MENLHLNIHSMEKQNQTDDDDDDDDLLIEFVNGFPAQSLETV